MTVSFRLATFNLENFDVSRGRESELERRIAILRPILRDMTADTRVCSTMPDNIKTTFIFGNG